VHTIHRPGRQRRAIEKHAGVAEVVALACVAHVVRARVGRTEYQLGLVALGRKDQAARALAESLDVARERQADHEIAFTLTAMADLSGQPLDEPLEKERQLLLERLGIVRPFSPAPAA